VDLKMLILCFALNYQRKYRSSDLITMEINKVGRSEQPSRRIKLFLGVKKTLSSSGLVLCTFAIVTLASIIVSCVLISTDNTDKNGQQYLFWIYVGSISWNGLVSLFLVYFAMDVRSSEGPRLRIKIMFILAVLLSLPSDLPFHIWRNCIFEHTFCKYSLLSNESIVIYSRYCPVNIGISLCFSLRLHTFEFLLIFVEFACIFNYTIHLLHFFGSSGTLQNSCLLPFVAKLLDSVLLFQNLR